MFDYKGNPNVLPKVEIIQAPFSTYNEKTPKPEINNKWLTLFFLPMPPTTTILLQPLVF